MGINYSTSLQSRTAIWMYDVYSDNNGLSQKVAIDIGRARKNKTEKRRMAYPAKT